MMYGSHHHPSSSSAAAAAASTYPLLHHQLHHSMMVPLPPSSSVPPFGGGGDDDEFPRRDERFPQWSNQETRDLIEMRAQVEWSFTAPKRNKNLWEMVADRMREKGYWRTADQCKWKWKYLVSRYKGQEKSDVDTAVPFFNELHAVFTVRANRLQQSQVEAEIGIVKGRKGLNDGSEDQSYGEFAAEQEDKEEIVEVDHQAGKGRVIPKQKAGREKRQKIREKEEDPVQSVTNMNKKESVRNGLQEIMRNFMQQQKMIDMEWRASMEKRAEERERFEQEWQQKMERLERERVMMERGWREREEERRERDERRAEQRDALLTALLNKLIHED